MASRAARSVASAASGALASASARPAGRPVVRRWKPLGKLLEKEARPAMVVVEPLQVRVATCRPSCCGLCMTPRTAHAHGRRACVLVIVNYAVYVYRVRGVAHSGHVTAHAVPRGSELPPPLAFIDMEEPKHRLEGGELEDTVLESSMKAVAAGVDEAARGLLDAKMWKSELLPEDVLAELQRAKRERKLLEEGETVTEDEMPEPVKAGAEAGGDVDSSLLPGAGIDDLEALRDSIRREEGRHSKELMDDIERATWLHDIGEIRLDEDKSYQATRKEMATEMDRTIVKARAGAACSQ
jgi:hypothetical protein